MTTNMKADFTLLDSGRTVEEKMTMLVDAVDYGASSTNTSAVNTVAINNAIQATSGGFVLIPSGIAYTEASIVFKDDVTVLVFSSYGTLTILSNDYGHSPVSKGGIAVKAVGQHGILLRTVDFGVTGEPFLQIVDLVGGDIAATHTKFIEMDEISAPANPSANKSRIYTRDDGNSKTQAVVQFPTGTVIPIATEGRINLKGSAVYDPASIADATGVTTTVAITGAAIGDHVLVSFSLNLQGIILTGYVSAADTVSVRFQNETGAAIDLASGTIDVVVLRNI